MLNHSWQPPTPHPQGHIANPTAAKIIVHNQLTLFITSNFQTARSFYLQ